MSNRLFRSERHLALVSDTEPGYRIAHPTERFCCDGQCTRALAQVESNCPRWPAGPTLLDHLLKAAQKCAGWLIFFGICGAIAVVVFSTRVTH